MADKLPGLKDKKVIITGGLGFIGSNLAHKCLELGAKVTVYDCLDPNSGGNIFNVKDIKDDIEIVFKDILDFDEISNALTGKDIIFNCSASTSHPFSMREPMIDLDVNGRGVLSILEAARRFNKDMKFVHIGTSTQLGSLHYRPADEHHPEFPTDIYSANKSVSEKYVLIYGKAYGMPVTVVRLPNVFGPKASIHSPEFTFVNYFVGLALQDKCITVYGDGKQLRNVLYVDDAVSALVTASATSLSDNEIFFAVGDEHISVIDIAKQIAESFGRGSAKSIPWPSERKAIEIGDAVLSNKKIKEILGWRPETSFSDGLRITKQYFDKCLKEYIR